MPIAYQLPRSFFNNAYRHKNYPKIWSKGQKGMIFFHFMVRNRRVHYNLLRSFSKCMHSDRKDKEPYRRWMLKAWILGRWSSWYFFGSPPQDPPFSSNRNRLFGHWSNSLIPHSCQINITTISSENLNRNTIQPKNIKLCFC